MAERFLAVLPALGQAGRARQWAQEQVDEFSWPTRWHPEGAVVALVVSELVTNALKHAGGRAGLTLTFGARRLRITVSDESPRLPVLCRPGRGEPGPWGLPLVTAAAEDWGVARHGTGKAVWADLAAPAPHRVRHLPEHRWVPSAFRRSLRGA